LRCEEFLDEMDRAMPWGKYVEMLTPFYKKRGFVGRDKKELKLMLKIHFLQQWYNLSDPSAEESIYDRISFQKFLGIDLLGQEVPDETTILNFRHFLEEHKLAEKLFELTGRILEEKGYILRKGTIVDATIISAPSSTKNENGKRDEEMRSTQKHGQWFFGMKAHTGVDADSGVVHTVGSSSANEHDKTRMESLLSGEEKAVFGDKGYYDEKKKKEARRAGIFWGVLDKGKRGAILSSSQERRNLKLSSIRAKVEHPFRILKCQWKYVKVRYKGLYKNSCQIFTLFMLANIYMLRKKLVLAT
jgi:IS5 family transposase